MTDLLHGLNPQQSQAAQTVEGPVLVLAGAGSGKTKTLTHRIAYLIQQGRAKPDEILAVTFTNKAAGEMRDRVLRLLGRPTSDKWFLPYLGTFHSICVRLLRKEYEAAGLRSSFAIFDSADSLSAMKQAMRVHHIDEKRTTPSLIQNLISSAKNELIGPERYAQLAHGMAQETAAKVYPTYQKLLRDCGALDFDDLLFEVVKLLRAHSGVLQRYQEQFKYILVDEYQDTNHAQYQITKQLAAKHRNICVVGDDWQSIYSWRGANFQNILDFEKDYPETKVVKLEENYRSTQNILDAAHAVISKNQVRSDKELWTKQGRGPAVAVEQVYNEIQEGELIIRRIKEAVVMQKRDLRDFAVLYRTNAQSRGLEEAFLRHNLPYKMVGGLRFYERKEIKDVLAYLRFIYQPSDIISFNRIINLPPRGLGQKSLEKLTAFQLQKRLTVLEAAEQAAAAPGLTGRAAAAFAEFAAKISQLIGLAEAATLTQLLEAVINRTGYINYLDDGSVLAVERTENVKELVSVAAEYNELGLANFLEEVALISDVDNYSSSSEAVTLMTLHAAKGLEFPVVFLPGMEEGIFPHMRSLSDPEQMEEERRLCYVGMTRAKHELHLLHTASRLLYGSVQQNPASRFLSDIPAEVLVVSRDEAPVSKPQPQLDLEPGSRIRHPKFGEGVVIEVNGDELQAAFAGFGSKKLSLSFAPIELIP